MSLIPDGKFPVYFRVASPAHFRVRSDLMEEFCLADAMAEMLPRTPEKHARWLQICGRDVPLASLANALPYQLTPRYVLTRAVLPNRSFASNLVTDCNRWSIRCELDGLFDFVVERAVEYAVFQGMEEAEALAKLTPCTAKTPTAARRVAAWSIGYERATGCCTILDRSRGNDEDRFLDGLAGDFSPGFITYF